MTVGMRPDIHPAGTEFTHLCPIERNDIIGSASQQLLESPKHGRIPIHQSGSDEEGCRRFVLHQDRQGVRVVVFVSIIECDSGDRFATVADLGVADEIHE